ncbi:MAG: NADH-quinone oxidoreductase subunit NuoE [Bacteroidales bacterium]|jgi:NADH-quinone oxidoreductase E subunit|nr:NADH-quinone oxidoreductase subunit NuoE [Bacteroidales bacterium]MDD4215847.1 NADH-quinone oxidoreductase subunit NuoE [Bacteroidales bacterium]MDY0140700.1 NADH-quinone oxidoreductase subunit NuoE [Bacteroidales bacterium]
MTDVNVIINEKIEKFGKERQALMPILQGIVADKNYITEDELLLVAETLDLSAADVYGTATFYTFLDVVPRGKYVIRVCKTISCHMAGKDQIIDTLEKTLSIKLGETTTDKKFTLLQANCMGWCHKGPVMLINDEVYPELTPEKAIAIIAEYIAK